MGNLQMFAFNLRLLIGLLVFGLIGLVLLVVFWTGVKVLLFRWSRRKAGKQLREKKYGADGRPIPPTSPGICEQCGQVFPEVFHLPGGPRLCASCYESVRST